MPLRCLIVDDSKAFLEASRSVLEGSSITVVGVAGNAADGRARHAELRPDVTLVDIDLGADDGLELARRLAEPADGSASPVILISAHPEEDFADLIEASPAVGFLPKSDLSAAAIDALLRRAGAARRGAA